MFFVQRPSQQRKIPPFQLGKRANAVLISQADWNAIQETLFLHQIGH
jgi:hypothetical protein